MVIVLFLLIGLGVILTLVMFSLPFLKNTKLKRQQDGSRSKTEGAPQEQIAEQIHSPRIDSEQISQTHSAIHEELSQLKAKEALFIDQLLEQKKLDSDRDNLGQMIPNILKLQDELKNMLALGRKNEALSNRISELNFNIEELQKEKKEQNDFIVQLRGKKESIQKELEDAKSSLCEITTKLRDAKKNEIELKEGLFRQKAMSSDSETDLKRLREENEELKDRLSSE